MTTWPLVTPGQGPLSQSAWWGAYVPPCPYPDCSSHYALESLLGMSLPEMSWFQNWSSGFPRASAETGPRGYELLIAWEPVTNGAVPVPFRDILAGAWDAYLIRYFTAAQAYPRPVTLRFCHEPNLGKRRWSIGQGCTKTMDEWQATWRYMYRLMRQVCTPGRSVQMMFCISTWDGPIPAEDYFPGVDYVDKVGFDAYSGMSSTGWTEPLKLLQPSYDRLQALAPGKPVWLAEVGCRQPTQEEQEATGRDKARWLSDLAGIDTLPFLTHVSFFNRIREQDWRVESSPTSMAAFQSALAAYAV